MPIARRDSGDTRVIAHLDLDCFYVQVEQRRRPELRGKPVAVVQYNPWKGGGLIAVSYEARRCGVLRSMRGDDAKKICPDIELLRAPWADGNAPSNWYRDAGTEVVTVLSRGGVCERASIDEVYLDITEAAAARLLKDFPFSPDSLSEEARKSHILGIDEQDDGNAITAGDWLCQKDSPRCDALLACGAVIVAELRAAVLAETQFTCSAGIAHNKMLAKLTSSMHKPAQQTVIPASFVPTLLATLPLKKIQRLGGKLGKAVQEDLGVKTPGDLLPFSQLKLQELYGVNTGTWLWNTARGKNGDEVQGRVLTKSHSCSRAFPGPKALTSMTSVMHWLGELTDRLQEQLDLDLELHNRKARLLVFHATVELRGGSSQPAKKFPSKSCPLRYGKEKILADCRSLFDRGLRDFCPPNQSLSPSKGSGSKSGTHWAVTLISIGAGDISAVPTGVNPISSFFTAPARLNSQEANQTMTSASESGLGEQGSEISRSPSWNSLDELMYDEQSGSLKPCSLGDDGSSDADVQCTPAFGSINSPVRQKSQFHLLDQNSVQEESISMTAPAQDVEPTLIQCSPVEHPVVSIEQSEVRTEQSEVRTEQSEVRTEQSDVRTEHSEVRTEHPEVRTEHSEVRIEPAEEEASRVMSPYLQGSGSKSSLKDLWQRNAKRSASNRWENYYKQEEIDEEVLAQLPAEIQMELRNSLKLYNPQPPQQRPPKQQRPSIRNFFPSSK